jgi:hypothetical protein
MVDERVHAARPHLTPLPSYTVRISGNFQNAHAE